MGLLAALGTGGARMADNCAMAGARNMRAADNVAITGSRTGARVGDDALRHGTALERSAIDDGVRMHGVGPHPVPVAGERAGLDGLGEAAADIGWELVSFGLDIGGSEPDEVALAVHRPLLIDLSTESWAWRRLVDGDDDVSVAPRLFVGRSEGEALQVGEELVPIVELANACARVGATCVFIGCEDDCTPATESVFGKTRFVEGTPLEQSIADFSATRLDTEPRPDFIAVANGSRRELKLLRPRVRD